MVPVSIWNEIWEKVYHLMDTEQDWTFFTGELVAGLTALMDDEGKDSFYRILAESEERGELYE